MRRMFTTFAVGMSGALIAALVVIAVPASGVPNGGGPGDPLLLSRVNQAGPMTVLKTNGGLRILAKNPKRPPLMVYTPDSMPPLDVSSTAKIDNLNADLLDGLDSSAFVQGSQLIAPFSAGAGDDAVFWVASETVVRSLTLTPPAAGTVVVNSTAAVSSSAAGRRARCSITQWDSLTSGFLQEWESAGEDGEHGQLAGTRQFVVSGGTPFTVNLVCASAGGTVSVAAPALTAIYLPGP
jgi:hypothetical protein